MQIQRIREQNPNVVVLSAGNFSPREDNFADLAIAAHLESMELMGYDAITLGYRELNLGPQVLREQIAINRSPVICSNLYHEQNITQKFKTIQRDDISIGIIAVIEPFRAKPEQSNQLSIWTINNPESSLKPLIDSLNNQVNLLILLSQLDLYSTFNFIDRFPEIDIAVVGNDGKTIQEPIKYRNSLVVLSGNRGQYLGKLDLTFDIEGCILSYQGELIPLDDTIPDDPEIAALVAEFKSRVEDQASESVVSASGIASMQPNEYIGAAACQDCHAWIYTKWQVTPHRSAFQTLYREGQSSNLDCIPCHTVGNLDGGFASIDDTPHLVNVQCESCHGKGANHAADPRLPMQVSASESTCLQCHCGEWGDNFDVTTAIKSVH